MNSAFVRHWYEICLILHILRKPDSLIAKFYYCAARAQSSTRKCLRDHFFSPNSYIFYLETERKFTQGLCSKNHITNNKSQSA